MSLHRSRLPGAEKCPIRDVLDRISDRWTTLVLFVLEEKGTLRFSALKVEIEDISQRMLAQTLRRLEAGRPGLAHRLSDQPAARGLCPHAARHIVPGTHARVGEVGRRASCAGARGGAAPICRPPRSRRNKP